MYLHALSRKVPACLLLEMGYTPGKNTAGHLGLPPVWVWSSRTALV